MAIAALIVLSAPGVLAAGWNKAYFGATRPGSWARYEQKASVGPASTATVTRLADEDGRVRIEERTEFAGNQTPASTNRYEMAKGFAVERDLIDYPKALVAVSSAAGNDKPAPMPADTVASMKKVMSQYAPTAVFKAIETIAGKSCDHYTYSIRSDASVESGDLWLSDAVPFGLVKKTWTTKDASGKVLYTGEQTLVDSGTRSLPATTTKSSPPPSRFTLKAAYDAGLLEISVEVDPKVKNGERLQLLVESKQEKPFTLMVPNERTSLHVGVPFDDLVFQPGGAQTFDIDHAHPARLVVTQLGEHRVTAGLFRSPSRMARGCSSERQRCAG